MAVAILPFAITSQLNVCLKLKEKQKKKKKCVHTKMCMCVCLLVCRCSQKQESFRSPDASVTGGCEMLSLGAGK